MFNNKHILYTLILCFSLSFGAMADDTEIYGTTSASVKPNVMIILDNSGSMASNKDVGGESYDRSKDYAAFPAAGWTPVGMNSVYYQSGSTWRFLTNNVANIGCATIITRLNTYGYANNYRIRLTNLACTGDRYNLKLGNFRNYENSTLLPEYRYVVAKQALVNLLNNTTDKYFGLMHFNGNAEGGYVRYPCGTANSTLSTYINGMTSSNFDTWTPLAETLAEAGRYFAGLNSWFNTGVTYTTPITEVCQKNYIILMTDGEPTQDINTRLWQTVYMNGKVIGDYDRDGEDFTSTGAVVRLASDGSLLLDDVAKFLFAEDIHTMGAGSSFVKQNIITHTIGLKTVVPLLERTAANGGGLYCYAGSSSGLAAALEEINNSITESNAVFLAPSVPVNRTIRTAQSDWLYLAYFKPQNTGEWLGNIKKFAIDANGVIRGSTNGTTIDPNQEVVDQYGTIKDNAWSFWTQNNADGNDVAKGGLGSLMLTMYNADNSDNRNIYYWTGGETDLTAPANSFSTTNAVLTISDDVVRNVRFFTDNWKLGAIIHSEPAIVHYSNTKSVIFVGANDGMLHCFLDSDDTATVDGTELWGFIPPGQRDNLARISDGNHDYYVDGSPTITYGDLISGTQLFQPELLIFGERRGGSHYYVLDINDPSKPIWKYQIDPDILTAAAMGGETMGQSWSKPRVCNIATGTEKVHGRDVPTYDEFFMIAGGYDTNQDLDTPVVPDNAGKAIYSVKKSNGALTIDGKPAGFRVTDNTTGLTSLMRNCIVDINPTSTYTLGYGKDITTRVYAGDLGGKVFAFADDRKIEIEDGENVVKSKVPDGTFPIKNCLFRTQATKKIFYAPATSQISNSYTEWVVFGTGDRENPTNTSTVNRIYAVKNNWLDTNLTETDLVDLTQNLIVEGTDAQKVSTYDDLRSSKGWYVTFYDPGEKMISPPIIINGYIFFTTYVPKSGAVSTDRCVGGEAGSSYLWSIDLETGVPAYDADNNAVKTMPERRIQVAVMAQPQASGENTIFTPAMFTVPSRINFDYFFWRQR